MDSKETKTEPCLEVTVSEGPERKRQGKFQPLRRLFGKKKRREVEKEFEETELKPSHSTGDVCNGRVLDDKESKEHLRELNSLGSRAFSHESIFIPEGQPEELTTEQTMSQENVSDKVRNLQRQIAQSIKFGQKPPSLRKSEGDEGSSDEEDVPRSPLKVLAQVEAEPLHAESKEKAHTPSPDGAYYGTPVKSPRTKRPPPPGTIESINLDAVPQSVPRLDNTAAKHKLSIKPKNQRVSRKHRRFTQDLQEVSDIIQEEIEARDHADESDVFLHDYARTKGFQEEYESTEKSKKQRLQEEELRKQERLELQRQREQEEERRRQEHMRREEEQRRQREEEQMRAMEEERQRRQEEERLQREEEERLQREEEKRLQREEEERLQREEEERLQREEEERLQREEEERLQREEEERKRREKEQRKRIEEEKRRQFEEMRRQQEAEEEERRKKEEEEKRRLQELEEKQKKEEEEHLRLEEERRQQEEMEAEMKRLAEEDRKKEEEERVAEEQRRVSDPEWKRRAEEIRWREMEERQRPFTFKVSSGEKQILFQKVNLTPVTPTSGQQDSATSETREGTNATVPGSADSPTLSSSLYVPHTAILVTGAQLCGTAVNLDQIKDTACKSLLGLSEDKKAMATLPTRCKTSPERKSGKTKSFSESSFSDQSGADVLAEWASIRSKIFKGAEDGKYQEYPDHGRKQTQSRPTSEEFSQAPFQHTHLRKTMSASTKFSIVPAKKKFADSSRSSDLFSQEERGGGMVDSASPTQPSPPATVSKASNRSSKTVRIADSAEECMFAKDLPSFLVPSPPHGSPKSQRSETESVSQVESEDSDTKEECDQKDQSSDERPSPFGIKLRRTNYSLRFHNEQPTEKRKKRYSAGDSFDGVPVPLTAIDPDSDSSAFSEKSSPASPSPLRENVGSKLTKGSGAESWSKYNRNTLPATRSDSDKFVSKPPLHQKPATTPKPSDSATPPPSPLPKPSRAPTRDTETQRKESEFSANDELNSQKEDATVSIQTHRNGQGQGQGEDEPKEKRSFFPSISIPWREKTDRRTELIRKEKPSLQSRHSLDSSRVQEKETGPLWITLALQKQKGFREQQQSREERKSQREVKLAEKQARERDSTGLVSPTEVKGSGNTSPPKAQTPEESKRPDTLLARFERRDNLKKANTLPSSVTVEIADSTPSPPATKEVSKRFPPGDTPQVSTEPAWLALAKRKAKAWSDCPQIIK
ncbi:capping protein inhibiting regulator of actin dynamics [Chanos chanos]|uniref:Capping protein inhibiting regulator of actin dynamics n=1 Tax=Chanos chanos TaxID=29144 RepID=A0A6J2VC76_CHACN|nr:cancer-related regulator of actin dynamics [Chanos chanos]